MGKIIGEGITFDDVLLVPQYSEVTPNMIELTTHLTKKIVLNIPMMSAAMDTVTEHRMAIAMARQGGIGIIHKNMSISQQAEQVDMVKRSENGVITNPFWLAPGHTLAEADELMAKYRISGVPICDNGKLIGIITNRDMKFETDMSQLIDNVMTKENLVTAPVGTTLKDAQEILRRHRIEKLPIVDEHMRLKGLITIKDIEKAEVYPNSARDEKGRLLVGAAIGATADVLDRVAALVEAKPEHQSYPQRVHGGVITALLDETLGRAINVPEPETWAVTGDISVRFKKPVPYGEPLLVTGKVTRNTRLIFESEGALYLKDGTLAASAHARYMKQPLDVIGDLESNGDIWVCISEPDDPAEIDIPE